MLSAQREIKAREASKAMQNERETKEDLKMKELIILDLTKKVCLQLHSDPRRS
jgi:hypothetical protein